MLRRFRRAATALVIVGALCSGLVVGAPEPGYAAAKTPAVSPSNRIAGEKVVVKGVLPTKFARSVRLQRKVGSSWRTVKRAKSTVRGRYSFRATVRSTTTTVRVVAPRTKRDGKTYKAVRSRARQLVPVAQSGTVTTSAPALQRVSRTATTSPSLSSPVLVTFRPARPGRVVSLQKWNGKTWSTVARSTQNGRGAAVFSRPNRAGDVYRALTARSRGAAARSTAASTVARWDLTFSDDFTGSQLDARKWGHRNAGNSTAVVGSRRSSAVSDQAVRIRGGAAELRVTRMSCGTDRTRATTSKGCFANAQIGTDVAADPFAFRYGVMAARIKFQRGEGMHGALWSPKSSGPDGHEIDVVEYFGDGYEGGKIANFVYAGDRKIGGITEANHLIPRESKFSSNYHVYSVEWSPTAYVFRVDGHEVRRITTGVSREKQAVLLSLLSSDWELPRIKPSTLENDPMKVDWVRVWQSR